MPITISPNHTKILCKTEMRYVVYQIQRCKIRIITNQPAQDNLWQIAPGQAILYGTMSDINPQENTTETVPAEETAAGQDRSWLAFLRRWGFLVIVAGAVIGLDQTAKMLVTQRLMLGQSWEPIPQIAGLIRITYSYNTGAAFGMLPQASDIFLILALVTIVAFIISYPKLPSKAWLSRLSIALISGGALSNAIDRLTRDGHVVDYVHVQLTPTLSNISNFADHAITVGVIILLADQWLNERKERQRVESEAANVETVETAETLTIPVSNDKL
jgi:signal peptidase II